jgi:hypothetical protein
LISPLSFPNPQLHDLSIPLPGIPHTAGCFFLFAQAFQDARENSLTQQVLIVSIATPDAVLCDMIK